MEDICIVCKHVIDDKSHAVKTERGMVHYGQCLDYINEQTLHEGEFREVLTETELLL